jgi:hypothetical protein
VQANEHEHVGPVSSSAPPTINIFSTMIVNGLGDRSLSLNNMDQNTESDQTLSLIGTLFDSTLPRTPEDTGLVDPAARSESQGSMATQNKIHNALSNESTLEGNSTDLQPIRDHPEMTSSSFFAPQGPTDQLTEAGNTDLGQGAHQQEGASTRPNQPDTLDVDEFIDSPVDLPKSPTVTPQVVSELQEDGQLHIESLFTTPKQANQPLSQSIQPEAAATPRKSAIASSSPLSALPSSPFGSPKSTTKETHPFNAANSQLASVSVDDAPPPEPKSGDRDQTSGQLARSKKENIYLQQTGETSDSNLKLHEASSNLSKSSPNHPSVPSQHRSAKTIRTPFRSPLLNKTLGANQQQPSRKGKGAHPTKSDLRSTLQSVPAGLELRKRGALSRIKGTGTTAARAAFKLPLRTGTSGAPTATNAFSSSHKAVSRNDPIQNRMQLLRRAVKIKESGEDEKLVALVAKWREVAKDVAWELWGLVKEGNVGEGIESRISAGSGEGFGLCGGNDRRWGNGGFDAAWGEDSQQNWAWAAGTEEDGAGSADIRDGKVDADAEQHQEIGMMTLDKAL